MVEENKSQEKMKIDQEVIIFPADYENQDLGDQKENNERYPDFSDSPEYGNQVLSSKEKKLTEELKSMQMMDEEEKNPEQDLNKRRSQEYTEEITTNNEEEERKFMSKMVEKKSKLEKEKRTGLLKRIINIKKVNREMGDQLIVSIFSL